ncbi:hypothetical protein BC830DRAFT_1079553 [Chytriomyces sp. MP71]|nr:hypothetical protein BC830DRAFT_1079553 [Chytriomyces sp. MP71]
MTRRQRQLQPKPAYKPLFSTRAGSNGLMQALCKIELSPAVRYPKERGVAETPALPFNSTAGTTPDSLTEVSTILDIGSEASSLGTRSFASRPTIVNNSGLQTQAPTVGHCSETAQVIEDVDDRNSIESEAIASGYFSSVTPETTSTPFAGGSFVEFAQTTTPQKHINSSRNQLQNEPSLLSLKTNGSPSGIASTQPDGVYEGVCPIMDIPTVIPSLIPTHTLPKPLGPVVRWYQYRRGEELDRILAQMAEEFVPTYLERYQMLEWLWKLESKSVRRHTEIQAGTLLHNAQTRSLQYPTKVHSPVFQEVNSKALDIATSKLLSFSPDRIRTAYNYVRMVLGTNEDSVIQEPKPVKQPPKQHGRAQSANIKPNTSTEVPVRTQSMPASQMEVSPRSKYIPLFATKSAVTSPVRSATPETTFVDADEMGSTMNASNVPTTPKKKAKRTARKVPSPSSSIVDLLACDRNSPVLAAIMKKWAQKNVPSNRTSPTKPRKPRSKKLPTVDPAEEPRQQPGMVVQSNALDCELLALLNETTNEELASMSTITSRNPSPDPFCNMEAYFQTQPPINFDSSFSATVPNCLSFPPLTTTELFAFDPIGLTIGSRSTGVTDFGHFGFQSDFSFLASGGPHSIEDVVSGPFSFGGIGDGMFSLPSSPNNALGGDTAAMVLDQVEAAQAMDLNDLFSL